MSNYVDLKDFIKETLIQIPQGIAEANEELKSNHGRSSNCYNFQRKAGTEEHDKIMFDIAITSQETKVDGGKIGFKICVLAGDAQDEKKKTHTNVSRIRFFVSKNPH